MRRAVRERRRPAGSTPAFAAWMPVGIAALALALAAGTAAAQATIQIGDPNDAPRRAFTFAMPPPQVRGEPLSPEMNARLVREPHHATILYELAQVHKARGDWKAIEQLARAERAAKKDSLLLAPEYALALDRLGRVKDATQVVLEARVADPTADWTIAELNRLVSASPREAASALKPVVATHPGDVGLVRVAATLAWRSGDPRGALQMLAAADRNRTGTPQRWSFAEDILRGTTASDSASAAEVFLDLAGDSSADVAHRVSAARRAWAILRRNPASPGAARVARALQDVPPGQWGDELVLDITRGLREAGLTADARALAERAGSTGTANPDLAVEKALADLREQPDDRALQGLAAVADRSPDAGFRYAEALFFARAPVPDRGRRAA